MAVILSKAENRHKRRGEQLPLAWRLRDSGDKAPLGFFARWRQTCFGAEFILRHPIVTGLLRFRGRIWD